jgi:hypothetical protein
MHGVCLKQLKYSGSHVHYNSWFPTFMLVSPYRVNLRALQDGFSKLFFKSYYHLFNNYYFSTKT